MPLTMTKKTVVGLAILLLAQLTQAQTAPSTTDVERRVDSILGKMTVDEKIEIIGGINDFYTRAIPRLGVPALRMSDGPMGVHDYGLTTAYPAGIALAASWDIDLAHRFGVAMGRDARARSSFHSRAGHEYLPGAHERKKLRIFWGRPLSRRADRGE